MYKNYGLDLGTTFLTVFSLETMSVVKRVRHEGKIYEKVIDFIKSLDAGAKISFTGKSGRDCALKMNGLYTDESVALSKAIEKTKIFREGYGKIIDIGGSSLTLYNVADNRITDISSNALCASGTGLFLEEQAERLGLELEKMGELSIENPPLIASRCTVFAKSDLIHHQQEGRTKKEMWAGLCRSLAVSAMNTLFRGEEIHGNISLIGGVAQNREVIRWLKINYPLANWIVPKHPESFLALGASYFQGSDISEIILEIPENDKEIKKMPPLTLKKSSYPEFSDPIIDDSDNEIRIHSEIKDLSSFALGMDIGSTSTKVIALDKFTKKPVFDIYRKTGGDPINAARKVFGALYKLISGKTVTISSFATTGSGRKLVGEIFGADTIVNEITAHGKGTGTFYPEVETIFEIGGQDAKYIRLDKGLVADVNMNYVCAAGTGSFVEEQARKLGFTLFEIGNVTKHIAPPVTSDRCTVFMEQDLRSILKQGFSKEEALASVLYSVVQNYLNKVVGNRPVKGNKIFFQGATARNIGLVAAFENLLGAEIVVSPFCHQMGSIGAALMGLEQMEESLGITRFIGLRSTQVSAEPRKEVCNLCNNYCRINFVKRDDGAEFSWGYQCGRDSGESLRKNIAEFEAFRERARIFYSKNEVKGTSKGTIYLPMSLTTHTYYPLWQKFFNILGYETKISSPSTTRKIKEHASKLASADFCFPVKVAIGHVAELLDKKEVVFQPHFIADKDNLGTAISFYCPYVESNPSVIRSSLERSHYETTKYATPVIDLRMSFENNGKNIYDSLKNLIKISRKEVAKAFSESYNSWADRMNEMQKKGEEILFSAAKSKKPVFVLIGRPYNVHDKGVNLGIPEIVASMGYTIIPIDMLSLNVGELDKGNYFNMFWNYGQKIVAAVKRIRNLENVFPIYLTNFNCGPDSFILNYAEEEIKGKPMLILELDEHDSDGGYQTRIEAFTDVVKSWMKKEQKEKQALMPDIYNGEREANLSGTLWIPPMHYAGSRLFAAAFRGHGFKAKNLDFEDSETLLLGKKNLRGGECLPMTLTLGAFLKEALKHENTPEAEKQILFMPTSEGPCRFGQYNLMERLVFQNIELHNAEILSPSSINSYQGLSEELRRYLMHAVMSADIMFKMLTKTRPYEKTKGDADAVFEASITELEKLMEKKGDPRKIIPKIADRFLAIPKFTEQKPIVGIVGEIYVRCNDFANGNLVKVIEENGGEAWLSPMHEWVLYTAWIQSYLAKNYGFSLIEKGESLLKNIYLFQVEKSYYKAAAKILKNRKEPEIKELVDEGAKYMPLDFIGEAVITVGRAVLFAKHGAKMVVNTAPFGCMPGTITASIFLEIKDTYNIPIINQFYDGDLDINDKVAALLKTISTCSSENLNDN